MNKLRVVKRRRATVLHSSF